MSAPGPTGPQIKLFFLNSILNKNIRVGCLKELLHRDRYFDFFTLEGSIYNHLDGSFLTLKQMFKLIRKKILTSFAYLDVWAMIILTFFDFVGLK